VTIFNNKLLKQLKKWREILERITVTVQTLAQQNLPLRGHRESVVSDPSPGNFLALLKYLAKFDPVMKRAFGLSFWKGWVFFILFSRNSK
jgi:hypothetical protein